MSTLSATRNNNRLLRRFRRFSVLSLTAVFALFWIGSMVRASGAGMGCPDWPTCFGRWIPPLSEQQLPKNYQQIYADRSYAQERFNVVKTWTEYLNRIAGVATGILVTITALSAIPVRRSHSLECTLAWLTFAAVCFQGWLGSQVVASNLTPGMVTLHMLTALVIVALIVSVVFRLSAQRGESKSRTIRGWVTAVLIMTVGQTILGTQVREMVDFVSRHTDLGRSAWVGSLPWFFAVHRSFSILLLLANGWLVWLLYRLHGHHFMATIALAAFGCALLGATTGAVLNHFDFPMLIQPLHLLAAAATFALQLYLLLWVFSGEKIEGESVR